MKPEMLRAMTITTAVTGALVALLAFLANSNLDPHETVVVEGSGANRHSASVPPGVEPATDDEVQEISRQEPTPAALAEIAKWHASRGYYFEADLPSGYSGAITITHSYTTLSDGELRTLSDSNDLSATVLLADRTLATRDEVEISKGIQLHAKGAALGSTYSAIQIGSTFLGRGRDNEENLVSAMAWYHFAAGRGDPAGNSAMSFAFGSSEFDDETVARVCQRSAEIRREMEQERVLLGLPGYDDTPLPKPAGMPDDPLFSRPFICPGD